METVLSSAQKRLEGSGVFRLGAGSGSWATTLFLIIAGITLVGLGCGLGPNPISLNDPQIQPLLRAIREVDRASLGFTPISTNAKVSLETGPRAGYDAMLHVYGETSRTIAFRKTESGYRWIAEQEIHTGPGWEQTIDGTFRETIVVEFQNERVNGIPTNEITIRYSGSNSNLNHRDNLTLDEIRPILAQWKTAPVEPRPKDLPDMDSDPGLFLFVILLLGMVLVACLLVLAILIVLLLTFVILGMAGVVSVALLTGALQRSVSSGFRALFLMLGATGGVFFGLAGTWAIRLIGKLGASTSMHLTIGAVVGGLLGLASAWAFNLAWMRTAEWLATKLRKKKGATLESDGRI